MTKRQEELLRAIKALMLLDKTPTLEAIATYVEAPTKHSIYNSIRSMRKAGVIDENNRPDANLCPGQIVEDVGLWIRSMKACPIPVALRDRILDLTDNERGA